MDDDNDWFPSVDGERTPLPVLLCPLSVDLRAVDEGVLPGVNLGMRLGVVESKKPTPDRYIRTSVRHYKDPKEFAGIRNDQLNGKYFFFYRIIFFPREVELLMGY